MAYRDFKSRDLEKAFNIKYEATNLLTDIKPLEPSNWLKEAIQRARLIGFTSEKSRSERLVSPVLTELSVHNDNIFTIYSGLHLDVDETKGLRGECDFVLSYSKIQDFIKAPIFSIVEAKKNDIERGTIQCAAQLIAAQILNKEDDATFAQPLYGCSTTGVEWRFLKLYQQVLTIDLDRYYIQQLSLLLGGLQLIVERTNPALTR